MCPGMGLTPSGLPRMEVRGASMCGCGMGACPSRACPRRQGPAIATIAAIVAIGMVNRVMSCGSGARLVSAAASLGTQRPEEVISCA